VNRKRRKSSSPQHRETADPQGQNTEHLVGTKEEAAVPRAGRQHGRAGKWLGGGARRRWCAVRRRQHTSAVVVRMQGGAGVAAQRRGRACAAAVVRSAMAAEARVALSAAVQGGVGRRGSAGRRPCDGKQEAVRASEEEREEPGPRDKQRKTIQIPAKGAGDRLIRSKDGATTENIDSVNSSRDHCINRSVKVFKLFETQCDPLILWCLQYFGDKASVVFSKDFEEEFSPIFSCFKSKHPNKS
jgi:hypothetical protein